MEATGHTSTEGSTGRRVVGALRQERLLILRMGYGGVGAQAWESEFCTDPLHLLFYCEIDAAHPC